MQLLQQQLQQTHRLATAAAVEKTRAKLEHQKASSGTADSTTLAPALASGAVTSPVSPIRTRLGTSFVSGSPATPGAATISQLRGRAERAEQELDRAIEQHRKEIATRTRETEAALRAATSAAKAAQDQWKAGLDGLS